MPVAGCMGYPNSHRADREAAVGNSKSLTALHAPLGEVGLVVLGMLMSAVEDPEARHISG